MHRSLSLVSFTLVALLAPPAIAQPELLVSGFSSNNIGRFDASSGAFLGTLTDSGLRGTHGVVCGPDGNLYAAAFLNARIVRVRPDGTSLGTFAAGNGLDRPAGLCFGPDRNLYVASFGSNAVLRFDGTTGVFIDAFVPNGGGGLRATEGIAFGPDGHLYACSSQTNQVLRYDGQTGASLGVFAAAGNNLVDPHDLVFDQRGHLYVSAFGSNRVNQYDRSGAFVQTVASGNGLRGVHGVRIGANGNLYVASLNSSQVSEFALPGGTFRRHLITAGNGVQGHANLLFLPRRDLAFYAPLPGGAGRTSTWEVRKATPNAAIAFLLGTRSGILAVPHCAATNGATLGMLDPQIMWTAIADPQGNAGFALPVPAALGGITVLFGAWEFGACRPSRLIRHTF